MHARARTTAYARLTRRAAIALAYRGHCSTVSISASMCRPWSHLRSARPSQAHRAIPTSAMRQHAPGPLASKRSSARAAQTRILDRKPRNATAHQMRRVSICSCAQPSGSTFRHAAGIAACVSRARSQIWGKKKRSDENTWRKPSPYVRRPLRETDSIPAMGTGRPRSQPRCGAQQPRVLDGRLGPFLHSAPLPLRET